MVKLVPISLLSTVFSSPPLVSEGCFLQIYINNLIMHTYHIIFPYLITWLENWLHWTALKLTNLFTKKHQILRYTFKSLSYFIKLNTIYHTYPGNKLTFTLNILGLVKRTMERGTTETIDKTPSSHITHKSNNSEIRFYNFSYKTWHPIIAKF